MLGEVNRYAAGGRSVVVALSWQRPFRSPCRSDGLIQLLTGHPAASDDHEVLLRGGEIVARGPGGVAGAQRGAESDLRCGGSQEAAQTALGTEVRSGLGTGQVAIAGGVRAGARRPF